MSAPASRLPATKRPRQDIPFVFTAFKDLHQKLGEIDALAAAVVTALRTFNAQGSLLGDPQGYLVQQAGVFQVNTRHVDYERLEPRTIQLLLVGVYQQAEGFWQGMRKEQKAFGRSFPMKNDDEPPMAYQLRTLPGGIQTNTARLGRERLDLFDYYRMLRNGFAHEGDAAKLLAAYANVANLKDRVLSEFDLIAPNPVGSLTHHDYLLFTRLTKYLATDICRVAAPTSAAELVHLISQGEFAVDPIPVITTRRNNDARARKGICGWFYTHYVYRLEDEPELLDGLMAWGATLPTWTERRRARRLAEGHIP